MKLSERTELGLNFTDKFKKLILDSHWSRIQPLPITQEEKEIGFSHIKDLFTEKGNQNYLMASPAMELASGIKIDGDKFDVKILSKIPDKKITFLLGKKLFY